MILSSLLCRSRYRVSAQLFAAIGLAMLLLVGPTEADDRRGAAIGTSEAGDKDAERAADLSERIDQLINQLGSDRYVVRRKAQQQLRRIGVAAFDQLHSAAEHADPEIATSARYLLEEVPIPWIRADDPQPVRAELTDYAQLSEQHRASRIERLSRLSGEMALPALARVARFDASPIISRLAAASCLRRPAGQADAPPTVDGQRILGELGASTRPAATWLRLFIEQMHDPAATLPRWQQIIDNEARLVDERSSETDNAIVRDLAWNLMSLYSQLGRLEEAVQLTDRILGGDTPQFEANAIELIDWLVERESWEVLDRALSEYDAQFATTWKAQYVAAIARKQQGRHDLADQLAARALEVRDSSAIDRLRVVRVLLELRGEFDWARAEYHRMIDNEPRESLASILARIRLAHLLFDLQEYQKAAQVFEPLDEGFQTDVEFRRDYNRAIAEFERSYGLKLHEPNEVSARRHFFLACYYEDQQNWAKQREHLEKSIELNEHDADVLIAMYHLRDADPEWRQMTIEKIESLSRHFQQEIDAGADDPNPTPYNQWAWLISNTEGDFDKAIRYSHRSLELYPGEEVYLDTLGRCYYAKGDLENAVKYQRQACSKAPHVQVMQRQLALFEKALAEQQGEDAN